MRGLRKLLGAIALSAAASVCAHDMPEDEPYPPDEYEEERYAPIEYHNDPAVREAIDILRDTWPWREETLEAKLMDARVAEAKARIDKAIGSLKAKHPSPRDFAFIFSPLIYNMGYGTQQGRDAASYAFTALKSAFPLPAIATRIGMETQNIWLMRQVHEYAGAQKPLEDIVAVAKHYCAKGYLDAACQALNWYYGLPNDTYPNISAAYHGEVHLALAMGLLRSDDEHNEYLPALLQFALDAGTALPDELLAKRYEWALKYQDLVPSAAERSLLEEGVPLPSERARAEINARMAVTTESAIPLQDLVEYMASRGPFSIAAFEKERAEAHDTRPFDILQYRDAAVAWPYSYAVAQQAAERAGKPLTDDELENIVSRLVRGGSPHEFREGVIALQALRERDKFRLLRRSLPSAFRAALDDDALGTDDILRGYELSEPVKPYLSKSWLKERLGRKMAAGDYADALRCARHLGDAGLYNDTLIAAVNRIRDGALPANPQFRLLFESAKAHNDKDAAARLGEVLYDMGYNAWARAACEYAGSPERAAMAARKMAKPPFTHKDIFSEK